ncbi:hypothetical protein [Stappia sp.]|uniref:hypothetical protein n=1 Tax=Stappia sp. TaxID=1870903 RepID=UPI003D151BB3
MKPVFRLLRGVLLFALLGLGLWAATELWFCLLTDANTRGLLGAALDVLGLALLAGIVWLPLRLLAPKRASVLSVLLAGALWSVGNYYWLVQDSSNGSFSLFAYGQLMIKKGAVTEAGHAIYLATLLSRLTMLAMMFILVLVKMRWRRA